MFKYLWIVALVMLFGFLVLLPFREHFSLGVDSVCAIVIVGSGVGAIIGYCILLLIDILIVSFCEFFDIKWDTIAQILPTIGGFLGAFIGFIYMIIEERKQ
jgi:hypothetical protein